MSSVLNNFPELREPTLVAAWPGMGHVGIGAVSYLKEVLGAKEIYHLDLPELFDLPGVFVDKGLAHLPRFPESKFYYWKNENADTDLVIFLGESQPSRKGYEYACKVLDIAEELNVKRVYTCAAAPAGIRHEQRPRVLAVANDSDLLGFLRKFDVTLMGDGSISGMNGLLPGAAAERNIGGICLLGQLPFYTVAIPNPRSSRAILEVLCKMLDITIDMTGMNELVHEADEEIDQMVRSSEQMEEMMSQMATDSQHLPAEMLSKGKSLEDEIWIRRRIDKLFEQTEQDKSKAHELKSELDKWDLFKEYEDRFLGLFKKENQ